MAEGHVSEDRIFFLEKQVVEVDHFEARGHILDIGGGGEGIIGQLKGAQVIAIDRERHELEQAPPGPLKIVMDARELQFLDSTFETVTVFFSLMYVRERADCARVLGEVYRVLQPGGRCLIWDAVLPSRPDAGKDVVAFPLEVRLPDWTVQTGFQVVGHQVRDRLFALELRKL